MKNARTIVPIICVLLGLGAGFFGGIEYKNYQANKARANFAVGGTVGTSQRFTGTRSGATGAARGGAVMGSVLSMDDKSVTVKMSDGSSKIVLFSDTTTYTNTIDATKSDLKVGENIAVFGSTNTDGSVTATNVQINPKFQMNLGSTPSQTNSTSKTKTTTQQQTDFGFGGPPPGM